MKKYNQHLYIAVDPDRRGDALVLHANARVGMHVTADPAPNSAVVIYLYTCLEP